jgi:uncharacterized protein (TIGR02246 family)
MKKLTVVISALVALAVFQTIALGAKAKAKGDDEGQIRALEDAFVAAVKARDVDAIMKNYVDDDSLLVFDIIPPRQFSGAESYRKDWETFLSGTQGPMSFEISDLKIETSPKLAYSHSIQSMHGTDKEGKQIDLTFRATDVYHKINGKWLIVHEHVSFPVDLTTSKPDLASKP